MTAEETILRALEAEPLSDTYDPEEPIPGCELGCRVWYISMDELFCASCRHAYEAAMDKRDHLRLVPDLPIFANDTVETPFEVAVHRRSIEGESVTIGTYHDVESIEFVVDGEHPHGLLKLKRTDGSVLDHVMEQGESFTGPNDTRVEAVSV